MGYWVSYSRTTLPPFLTIQLGDCAQEVRDGDVLRADGGVLPAAQEGVAVAVHAARGAPQGGHAAHQGTRAGRALQEARAGDVIQPAHQSGACILR